MIDRGFVRLVSAAAIISVLFAGPAAAAKKKTASTPAPAPATSAPSTSATPARPDSTVPAWRLALAQGMPPGTAYTPGVLVRPGSPVEDRTTIVPFPIPGDTGRAAIAHSKLMNIPRAGETLVEPLPRTGSGKMSGSNLYYWGPPGTTAPFQVDVLPEQLTAIAPEYPKAARDAGIQGTVMVMAFVQPYGTLSAVHVVKSIPALDDAAVQAVKKLRFKPALFQGRPVGVWVGIPVKFTIH